MPIDPCNKVFCLNMAEHHYIVTVNEFDILVHVCEEHRLGVFDIDDDAQQV